MTGAHGARHWSRAADVAIDCERRGDLRTMPGKNQAHVGWRQVDEHRQPGLRKFQSFERTLMKADGNTPRITRPKKFTDND